LTESCHNDILLSMEKWTTEASALTDLILEVFRVNGDLIAAGDGIAGEFGQSSARWQVLGALAEEVRTVPGIAREMGLARQSVQRTVDVLEAEGIVEYLDNPAHRRSKLVGMTARGRDIYRKILARQVRWVNGLVADLPVSERDIRKGLSVLQHLRARLERPKDSLRTMNRPGATRKLPSRREVRR
jgi:DNA-binding MarR family transcriptional regulator